MGKMKVDAPTAEQLAEKERKRKEKKAARKARGACPSRTSAMKPNRELSRYNINIQFHPVTFIRHNLSLAILSPNESVYLYEDVVKVELQEKCGRTQLSRQTKSQADILEFKQAQSMPMLAEEVEKNGPFTVSFPKGERTESSTDFTVTGKR
ncbi:hypothetical protein FNV43_RR17203 [Rhamnella rubrinervis]|uniref:Uncharacterized protein n=1 Tax=Rhamnella rubrinervis TaxID=2594499 RepID=A0A8K0GVJ6_9ROSA|nr:hypothetical protein FNV43_RR17203 [Rhamnella rubrinervis]